MRFNHKLTATCLVVAMALVVIPAMAQTNTGTSDAPVTPRVVVATTAPGTGAPPPTLGGFTMIPVPTPGAPACTGDTAPIATPGGPMAITPTDAPTVRCIGAGWSTWSHGYTGDVYYTGGPLDQSITPPPGTKAIYFYVEPNPFTVQTCSAVANGTVSTGNLQVDGNGGARYIGFHSTAGENITSVRVQCDTDFATGEYAVAGGGRNFGGTIQGALNGLIALCRNGSTGDSVAIPIFGSTSWSCTDAGLTGSPGDTIIQISVSRVSP
jgi:hypothetical protein